MSSILEFTRRSALALSLAGLCFTAPSAGAAEMGDVDDTIKLAIHEWTGQHISTMMIGRALKEMGYKVDFVTAGYLGAGTALADGNLTASLEVWDNNLGDFFPKLLAESKIEDLGDLGLDAGEGFMYPAHVAEKCPGLPAYDAFAKCAQVFATGETFPKGRFLEYPADWSNRATQMINAEKLPFTAVPAGSEGALVAELKSSIDTGEPLVMMFWSPHWILSEAQVGWVEIPTDVLDKHSMAKPRVFKIVWPGTKDKWPAAYNLMKAAVVTNEIQEPLMAKIDRDGEDAEEVVNAWMDANKAVWQGWIDAAKQ
ncbi:MAG: ABC transporter substrate-binding protein [Pseudomonadota bacterium]